MVFASVLICEVALYIAWKILNAGRAAVQTVSHSPIADPSEARRSSEATEPPDEDEPVAILEDLG